MFLGFGVDVPEDVDVRVVDPEPAEQRGHPGDTRHNQSNTQAGKYTLVEFEQISVNTVCRLLCVVCWCRADAQQSSHTRRSRSMRLTFPPMKTRILQSPHLLRLVSRYGISSVRPGTHTDTNPEFQSS